jgi:hypothetical protein
MTEDWCGDALMNLPIVARIVEALPGADLRLFGFQAGASYQFCGLNRFGADQCGELFR